jgi:hypothetical protein
MINPASSFPIPAQAHMVYHDFGQDTTESQPVFGGLVASPKRSAAVLWVSKKAA